VVYGVRQKSRIASFEIDKAFVRTSVWKLAVSRKEWMRIRDVWVLEKLTSGIEIGHQWVWLPRRVGRFHFFETNKLDTNDGRKRLGEINGKTSSWKLVHRYEASIKKGGRRAHGQRDGIKETATHRSRSRDCDFIKTSAIDETNGSVLGIRCFDFTVFLSLIWSGQCESSRASVPAKFQRGRPIEAATVASRILHGTIGTSVVERFHFFALRITARNLTSMIIKFKRIGKHEQFPGLTASMTRNVRLGSFETRFCELRVQQDSQCDAG
jgi:hypothetical protein